MRLLARGHPPTVCLGPGSWRSRNRRALRHPPTRVLLGKSRLKVLGGWESPRPCTDLPTHSSPGVPSSVTLWGALCPGMVARCPRCAAGMCPPSAHGCLQWEHWVCPSSPMPGCALGQRWGPGRCSGTWRWGAVLPSSPHPLPWPHPSAAVEDSVRFLDSASGPPPPTQSFPQSPHLEAGCTCHPITIWVPCAMSLIRHLLLHTGGICCPKPTVLGESPALTPPGVEPWEVIGAKRCWERC